MNIFIYLMACYGATNILASSKLTKPLRDWLGEKSKWVGYFVNCFMCMGYWVGLGLFLAGMRFNLDTKVDWFVIASAGSGFCWMVRVVLNKLDEDSL
jgi:hypothetical protein